MSSRTPIGDDVYGEPYEDCPVGSVREALESALLAVNPDPKDAATVELARKLADRLDFPPETPVVDNVTPSVFLKTLTALGMTPEARGILKGDKRDGLVSAVAGDSAFDPDAA